MMQVTMKIFLSDALYEREWEYRYGSEKNTEVVFTYYKPKTDEEVKSIRMPYPKAIRLAEERQRDGRYRNYEFLITMV